MSVAELPFRQNKEKRGQAFGGRDSQGLAVKSTRIPALNMTVAKLTRNATVQPIAQEAEFAGRFPPNQIVLDKSKTKFEQKLPEGEWHDELELPAELHESRDSLLNITTEAGADK